MKNAIFVTNLNILHPFVGTMINNFNPKKFLMLIALTLDTSIQDTEWTTDTFASNHMTGNSKLLFNLQSYLGIDSFLIGNGHALSIKAVGDIQVKNDKEKLMLRDVFLVSSLARNLLSDSQLIDQFPLNWNSLMKIFVLRSER